jgi:hypothetical protein
MRRLRAGLVTPPPGGLGTRSGGTRTPPRGARWTGTGANASSPETRTREPKVAAVERREARLRRHGGDAPRQACRAASPAAQGTCAKPPRFSALRSLKGARKGRRPTRGRSNNTGAHARPFGIRAMMLGCLKIKSMRRWRLNVLPAVDVNLGAVHVRRCLRAQHVDDLGHLVGRA